MPMIRASEVGEYVFCARAWWLRRVAGEEPAGAERRAQGTSLHARHGRSLRLGRAILWLGLALFVIGLGLVVWA
ncbi:MAG: hypothetical protein AB4911_20885 [Oscillochloridaceae bacterium umkhey_bin13]